MISQRSRQFLPIVLVGCACLIPAAVSAQPPAAPAPSTPDGPAAKQQAGGLIRLAEDSEVWIDTKRKLVVVDGEVCLRRGVLEMFACPKGSKTHESIVSVSGKASIVHTGLLAVGAKPGSPVKFDPEYVPASGDVIDIYVLWTDEAGKRHKTRAQEWVRNLKTEKQMEHDWVFAGSGFWKDDEGNNHYYGDAGDFICVSNFTTATMDLPVKSSAANAGLLFEAFTERIPPLKTKVRLVLIPRLKQPAEPAP